MTQSRLERIDDPQAVMQSILDTWQTTIWTALPAIVRAVHISDKVTIDAECTVQAMVTNELNESTWIHVPLLVDLPVLFPSGGGFLLTFPIQPGDEVLVIFASRCIDAWWQSGGVQPQIEFRMHDLSDGFALPGPFSQPRKPEAVNLNNVQLRNMTGDTFVEITPGKQIRLETPNFVEVKSPTVNIDATTITSKGNWSHNGDFASAGGAFTHNGKNVGSTHSHSGVETGGGNTGAPV